VEIVPRKKIVIRGETVESFVELWNARLLVEPYLTELATARADERLIEELRGFLAIGRKRHRSGDRRGCMEIDRTVHQRVYQASGNRLLADFACLLLDRSMRLWFTPFVGRYEDDRTMDELAALVEAIERRDPAAAGRLMAEHIGSLRGNFARLQEGIDAAGVVHPDHH
jgi:DNA-binding GntR family transcriptional regulator